MVDSRTKLLKEMTLLYVEDDNEIIEAVKFSFNDTFKEIVFSTTAEDALDMYTNINPDIIITDVCLPFMNGIELTKIIKEKDTNIPILIISGHKEADMLLSSIDAKVDCYMTKPINLRMLKQNLYKLADAAENRKKLDNNTKLINKVLDNSREHYIAGDNNSINYMNATLLELLGYSNIEEANRQMLIAADIKIVENSNKDKMVSFIEWIDFVKHMDGYESMVSIICPGVLKSDAKSYITRVSRIKEDNSYIISFVDVTVIERQKQFFHNLAMKDPLTGIYNRNKFQEEIRRETERSRRYGVEYSIIMFDIDKFKDVNDKHGHQVGDNVLKELADLVSDNIRTTDIFARYGGEEFIIIAPEVNEDGAERLAEKLRQVIESYKFEHAGRLTCSFGIAGHKKDVAPEDIIKQADEALYKAKAQGRNKIITA